MTQRIQTAGVIGAGVMGANIAAHLANVGIKTVLLDIVPNDVPGKDEGTELSAADKAARDAYASGGLKKALQAKPASFYLSRYAGRIAVGNLEDDLHLLKDVDWIVEVVVENLAIKQSLFEKLEAVLAERTIITSNTSGISAAAMCAGRSELFRRNFAITHFFNPPRYLKLLEIVPGPDTAPEVMDTLGDLGERVLGKGVVVAHDTPNFVANRVGVYAMFSVVRWMEQLGLTVEAVDALSGPMIGRAKSASFRTLDLVGLDTLVHAAGNVYDNAPDDERREKFKPPQLIDTMVQKGLLGEKSGGGFFKKTRDPDGNRLILSLDTSSYDHTPQEKVKIGSIGAAKTLPSTKERLRALYFAKDKGGEFTFAHLSDTMIYAANRLGEIAETVVDIDNAMKWGFAWKYGPFEAWDVVGVPHAVKKMQAAGRQVPTWVEEMLAAGHESFYKEEKGVIHFYDPSRKDYRRAEHKPEIVLLPEIKGRTATVAQNSGATLIDIGDGVACLEFHSKMNAIGDDIIRMINQSVEIVSRDFDGLVLANHADNFSVGANLAVLLFAAQEEEWDDIDFVVRQFQGALSNLKFMDKPVVAAPSGMALGGGCEVCLAVDRVRFAAESYIGLVEAGVGLIPAGGGTKEMLLRATENLFEVQKGGIASGQIELKPFIARAFETVAMGKVSTSGPEAVEMGYLRSIDRMTVNRDFLIHDAKQTVLAMNMERYESPEPKEDIRVGGEDLLAMLKLALWSMHHAGYITEHDVTVSTELGRVLCGGNVKRGTKVSEHYLLDLEREAFLRLCGMPKSQARMAHILKTGKPLRN